MSINKLSEEVFSALKLSTWSGRGLQPNWLKAALATGKTLADFTI